MKALNFGSLNLDYVYQVDHFVGPGETLSALSQSVNPGGKGLNQSVALARAGAPVYHGGCVGAGGELLAALLEKNGVDTRFLRRVEAIQGNAMIQVAPSGENCILLFGGSNQQVSRAQIEEALSQFGPGDYLVLQNYINNLPLMVELAHDRGMILALNPNPYNDRLTGVDFAKLSWLLVNEVEAEQISGSGEPQAAWEAVHSRWPGVSLVVTLGKRGSVAFPAGGGEPVFQPAFPAKAVDTTGAGDTFTGYFLAGLMEARPLPECMVRASLAAALSVARPGAADSIPTREELEIELARRS